MGPNSITRINNHDLAVLLFNSFRYCLGRRTYAVSEFVSILRDYWNVLPDVWQKKIKSEIRSAIVVNNAGDKMDIDEWQKILELEVK